MLLKVNMKAGRIKSIMSVCKKRMRIKMKGVIK